MKQIKSKKSQEEMVGFALIVILVTIILLVFLFFSLRTPQKELVENYEVDNFMQALLYTTTDCRDNIEYLSVEDLIYACNDNENCLDERDSCEVLNSTLQNLITEGWGVGDRYLGYNFNIKSDNSAIFSLKQGNSTNNWKNAHIPLGRDDINVTMSVYY